MSGEFPSEERTVIIGAGAVGLALGSCLHASGRRVHFVVRPGLPHPMEIHGIQRTGILGPAHCPANALEVSRSIADLVDFPIDAILVCTKSTANPEIARNLATNWGKFLPPPLLVICQNGWGNAETFAEIVEPEHIASASILTGFRRGDAHRVEVTVHARAIQMGCPSFSRPPTSQTTPQTAPQTAPQNERLEALCAAISAGGIPCETTTTIQADLGAKLLYNCLLNPLGALANAPYGRLGEAAPTRTLMETIAREIFDVFEAAGIRTHWADAESYMEVFYRDLLPPTAGHESSMLQDLQAGRPTEIDALCGAVDRLARKFKISTPVNTALLALIRAVERNGRTRQPGPRSDKP